MKNVCLLLLLLLLTVFRSEASHIYGADFYYTALGNNTYRVTLEVYGDCAGGAFNSLPASTPGVELRRPGIPAQEFSLFLQAPTGGVEVTPVCPSQINNTACNGGTLPGVKRYVYSNTIVVGSASPNWVFRFTGAMVNGQTSTGAGRSNAITNLVPSSSASPAVMALEAELNNSISDSNSSPRFTTIPTPFYCINVSQQYNQGAIDPNGDQLTYALVNALNGNGGTAPYVNGYSGANPLSVQPGAFNFNTTTGQLSFTPNALQQSAVVNKVTEYRNGVKVGSAMREMTFVVLPCNNNPPSGPLTAASPVSGGQFNQASGYIEVCEGSSPITFHIYPTDPENTAINVTVNGASSLPGTASVNIFGNNTPTPDVYFYWNATGVAPGFYTIFITYKDAGCPLASLQTQAYSVRIVRKPTISHVVTASTGCVGKAAVDYVVNYGLTPRTITVSQGSTTIKTITGNNTATVSDSLLPGTYTITVGSSGLPCSSTYQLTVVDSGRYPYKPVPDSAFFCLGEPGRAMTATGKPGATIVWTALNGTTLTGAPFVSTGVAGEYKWLVYQQYLVCRSLPDTAVAYVTLRPTAAFNVPSLVCARDTISIQFTGSTGTGPILEYRWDWQNANVVTGLPGGPYGVRWDTPGVKTIRLQVLENKCASTPVVQTITVKPKPVALFAANNVCRLDTLQVRYNATPLAGQGYLWSFQSANIATANGPGPYDLVWTDAGNFVLRLAVWLDGCSDTVAQRIQVYPKPTAMLERLPQDPCLGDKIYLKAEGGVTYRWTPQERIFTEPDGRIFTYTMVPGTYTVNARNEYGCSDSAAWTINSIQPCCNFSYPNAFSPNGDGRNDGFRVILYGNPDRYNLTIFNRWGQKMFQSFDPKSAWDGTFNGVPCEVGTYMYHLKARCMTGREEEQSGDLMLVR